MRREGYAFVIALVFLFLCTLITSILLAIGLQGGEQARADIEKIAAVRAAEIGVQRAVESLGQSAAKSYFSDPVESYYWFGGDLPNNPASTNTADGAIANDGEIFGDDAGLDGLPNILEPGFHLQGETASPGSPGWTFNPVLDPGGDDLIPIFPNATPAVPTLQAERNGKYDLPLFTCSGAGPCLVGYLPNGTNLVNLGFSDVSLGADQLSSFNEITPVPGNAAAAGVPYHPITNCDPAGDDYHPIFNPMGEEGRVRKLDGTFALPTVENADTRWRRHIEKVGTLSEVEEGKLNGYCAVRAIDTSSKIDLNGPSLLTARLLNSLVQMTGTASGPISALNPPLGKNGRGIETGVINLASLGFSPGTVDPLEWPYFFLMKNPATSKLDQNLVTPGPIPQKIAATPEEEDVYFHQPPNQMDSDAILIIKFRNRELGGKFTSVTQLLDVKRINGSPIFDDRSRDELLRLSDYLAVEVWRDPSTISHRNGEPLVETINAGTTPPSYLWGLSPKNYFDPEPWQDIFANKIFEGGEDFNDYGFDNRADSIESGYHPFKTPDPVGDDFNPIWNPFFIRSYTYQYLASGAPAKHWKVGTTRYEVHAWSPFATDKFYAKDAIPIYSQHALPHKHYPIGTDTPTLDADTAFFNFNASEGNGILDLDPYWSPSGGVMASEPWSGATFDSGTDQRFDQNEAPKTPWFGLDPNRDNFSSAAAQFGKSACPGGHSAPRIYGMAGLYGSESSTHFDPYPELGATAADMPFPSSLYQVAEFPNVPGFSLAKFLKPQFQPLPSPSGLGPPLQPPLWARPDGDWFVEPGEPFLDNGRDRLPFTGDPGEGDGMWEPGEEYRDYGLDGVPNSMEQAFSNVNLTLVLSNCNMWNPVTGIPGDYHADDFRFAGGEYRGSEGDGRFNLLREPYIDLNRDGKWTAGHHDGTVSNPGTFFDLDGSGVYNHGVFRESRAPVNVNAAPEEVLAAVIHQGLFIPVKMRQDRFMLTPLDNPTSINPTLQDFNWNSVFTDGALIPSPNQKFAYDLSRGLARAIVLRRLGLYNSSDPNIGNGPFQDWQEFELFVRSLLINSAETARFASGNGNSIHPTGRDWQNAALTDPFGPVSVTSFPGGSGYESGAFGLRKLMADRILIQANPNSRLRGPANYPYVNPAMLDKEDFPFPTTEFCFGPTGIYEVTAIGYAVSGASKSTVLGGAQVVGSASAFENEELLASKGVRAQVEKKRTIKIFEHNRLSTRDDFLSSRFAARGTTVYPKIIDPTTLSTEASGGMRDMSCPSDFPSSDVDSFLLVKPEVNCFDPVHGLLFTASQASAGTAPSNPYNNQNDKPAGVIQVFQFDPEKLATGRPAFTGFPRNNGVPTPILITRNGLTFNADIGLIGLGNGLIGTTPQIQAMAFDPDFPAPPDFTSGKTYLGRLYFLDDLSSRLRIVDIGRDPSGGLLSQERTMASAVSSEVSYSGYSGAAIALGPSRREIYFLLRDNNTSGGVYLMGCRYSEAKTFPDVAPDGSVILHKTITLVPVGSLRGYENGKPDFLRISTDPTTGYLYMGGNIDTGGGRDARIYRYRPEFDLPVDQVFPWISYFHPPGYEIPTFDLVALTPVDGNRRLVGMELDYSSGIILALWNRDNTSAAVCLSQEKANGDGAYLTAIPLGTAPFMSVAMMNPFPMELSQTPLSGVPADDTHLIYAAGMGLDPVQKTVLVIPREQACESASGADLKNPYTRSKSAFSLVSYLGDGLRLVDSLNTLSFWTDPSQLASVEKLSVLNVPGKNLFMLPMVANQVTDWQDGLTLQDCPTPSNPTVPWKVSREIRLVQVEGYGFLREGQAQSWEDGKILLSSNAVPLASYLSFINTRPPLVHSRSNFEQGLAFSHPEYKSRVTTTSVLTPLGPVYPVASRAIAPQTNGQLTGEGLFLDEKAPQKQMPSGLFDQRIYFPQDTVGVTRDIVAVADETHGSRNIENGWRVLDGGGEFWIRFGDLSQFNPATAIGKKLIIYENFTKVRAPLQQKDPNTGALDFSVNPFLAPSLASTDESRRKIVYQIVQSQTTALGYSATLPDFDSIVSYEFCPDSMEVWVYDCIYLENIDGVWPDLKANISYERKLAGAAGQYPGIYKNATQPWGIFEGCSADFNGSTFLHPFEGAAGENLSSSTELQKYPVVKFTLNDGSHVNYRFVPIWNNTDAKIQDTFIPPGGSPGGEIPISATVKATIPDPSDINQNKVKLLPDQWMRFAYASKLTDQVYAPGQEFRLFVKPSVDVSGYVFTTLPPTFIPPVKGETLLYVWDYSGGHSRQGKAVPIPPANGWFDFPMDREGFMAFGAYLFDSSLVSTAPRVGGPVVPGFSYTVDDVVFYERSGPVTTVNYDELLPGQDCVINQAALQDLMDQWLAGANNPNCSNPNIPGGADLGILLGNWNKPSGCAAVQTVSRFENGESGWPQNDISTFPGGSAPTSPYLPPEPFLDFNNNGRRDVDQTLLTFWDFNKSNSWDFGEPRAFWGDPLSAGQTYGEPFTDLNANKLWDASGDILIDFNNNGVFDAGDSFIDLNGNNAFDPRYGEPFADKSKDNAYDSGETFFDENRNGKWDAGEPFTSWSLLNGPQLGELYRENKLALGYEPGSFIFITGGLSWNQKDYPANNETNWNWAFPPQLPPPNPPNPPIASPPDWNDDGRYEPTGFFEGIIAKTIPAGSRIDSLAFTAWRPLLPGVPDLQGRVAIDLEFYAKDGRFLGRWAGVDNLASQVSGGSYQPIVVRVDESGIGFPVTTETLVRYRINFYMPSTQLDQAAVTRPTSSPVFDDLTLTVTLPPSGQTVYEDHIVAPILVKDFERGRIVQ